MIDTMNRFELQALGKLMYGNSPSWRSEIQKALGLSSKSNTLNRILDGEYLIKDGIAEEMYNHLVEHHLLVQSAVAFLNFRKTKEKIALIPTNSDEVIVIDRKGINKYQSLLGYQQYLIDSTSTYIYYHAILDEQYNVILPFFNKVIENIFIDIEKGKASKLDIEKYFYFIK